MILVGPKQVVADQTVTLMGPKQVVAGVEQFVANLKKAVASPTEGAREGTTLQHVKVGLGLRRKVAPRGRNGARGSCTCARTDRRRYVSIHARGQNGAAGLAYAATQIGGAMSAICRACTSWLADFADRPTRILPEQKPPDCIKSLS